MNAFLRGIAEGKVSNMENNVIDFYGKHEELDVYYPAQRPGFTAWATAFSYGDGRIGVSFDEAIKMNNPDFIPPTLEFGEAVGAPVSYGSVECGTDDVKTFRVYLVSGNGKDFTETGRCPREQGSYCNVGYPDGRILGFDVPTRNEDGTGWCDYIRVSESADGGTTWKEKRQLLKGTSPYLWRVRQLRDGTIVIVTSLYGTPWGHGRERSTRNTMLAGETYINKIQSFFLTSTDGQTFSEPHYILPGIGAHEYDFVELEDGRLLFIAGDVQGTPVGRQFVTRTPDGWINGALFDVKQGAPPDPKANPQGGYMPETIAMQTNTTTYDRNIIVGYRRNKCYSVSNDYGENWHKIVFNLPEYPQLYQPVMISLPSGYKKQYQYYCIENIGHVGGDSAVGQEDMCIRAHLMSIIAALPSVPKLGLQRVLTPDNRKFANQYIAKLTIEGKAVEGEELVMRFVPFWNADGSVNTTKQSDAPYQMYVTTNVAGEAEVKAEMFDDIPDIYYAYNVDVACTGRCGKAGACQGPMMTVNALTPQRKNRFPYQAYFAEGILYLSPELLQACPQIFVHTKEAVEKGETLPDGILDSQEIAELVKAKVLIPKENGTYRWLKSVHAPSPLAGVQPMVGGDWYI